MYSSFEGRILNELQIPEGGLHIYDALRKAHSKQSASNEARATIPAGSKWSPHPSPAGPQ